MCGVIAQNFPISARFCPAASTCSTDFLVTAHTTLVARSDAAPVRVALACVAAARRRRAPKQLSPAGSDLPERDPPGSSLRDESISEEAPADPAHLRAVGAKEVAQIAACHPCLLRKRVKETPRLGARRQMRILGVRETLEAPSDGRERAQEVAPNLARPTGVVEQACERVAKGIREAIERFRVSSKQRVDHEHGDGFQVGFPRVGARIKTPQPFERGSYARLARLASAFFDFSHPSGIVAVRAHGCQA
jgi:hypothetical protein